MDLSRAVINYCERTSHAFWAEPVNAMTNLAFFLAAAAAWSLWRDSDRRDWASLSLILVTALTGAGSFLFHTFATRWAMLADVIPIAVFIYGYFLLSLTRFVAMGGIAAIAATLAFAAFSFGLQGALPRHVLNNSLAYAPALMALMAVPLTLALQARLAQNEIEQRRKIVTAVRIAVAGGVFALSLVFRTIDRDICALVPVGTHFLWHLLNAFVLYLLLRAAILWRS